MADVTGRGKRGAGLGLAFGLLALLACASVASATPAPSRALVTAFPQPRLLPTGGAGPLTIGPEGDAWFTQVYEEIYTPGGEPHHLPRIVRMNQLGQVSVVAEHERAEGFARTADGSVWFTGSFHSIGRILPGGVVASYPLPETATEISFASREIVAGADGNIWFSGSRSRRPSEGAPSDGAYVATISRITPGGAIAEFDLPGRGGYPTRLALAPDGNVWFTEYIESTVGRITPAGQITRFPLPRDSRPGEVVAGPDGALWFTEATETGPAFGRVTTAGEYSQLDLPVADDFSAGWLATGPDGRLWFTLERGAIARISPSGRLSRVQLPQATAVTEIVPGPEGNVWYTAQAGPPCAPGDSGCGQGGYFEAGIVGRIAPAPLSVSVEAAKLARRGRQARVWVNCLDGRADSLCRGRLRIRAAGTTSQRRYALGADLARGFGLRLTPPMRERLQRSGHLRIACTVTLAGGQTAGRELLLKLPRRPR
jgi:virginiamycin B lyase